LSEEKELCCYKFKQCIVCGSKNIHNVYLDDFTPIDDDLGPNGWICEDCESEWGNSIENIELGKQNKTLYKNPEEALKDCLEQWKSRESTILERINKTNLTKEADTLSYELQSVQNIIQHLKTKITK